MQCSNKVLYPELSYKINGIVFTVHNKLGRFLNEKLYCDAIENELKEKGIGYEREKVLPTSFIGEKEGRNKIDFIIKNVIILEIKAKNFISKEDYFQLKRYLTVSKLRLGLLVNFRDRFIRSRRILLPYHQDA